MNISKAFSISIYILFLYEMFLTLYVDILAILVYQKPYDVNDFLTISVTPADPVVYVYEAEEMY